MYLTMQKLNFNFLKENNHYIVSKTYFVVQTKHLDSYLILL